MKSVVFVVPGGISFPDEFGRNKNVRATQETTDMSRHRQCDTFKREVAIFLLIRIRDLTKFGKWEMHQ